LIFTTYAGIIFLSTRRYFFPSFLELFHFQLKHLDRKPSNNLPFLFSGILTMNSVMSQRYAIASEKFAPIAASFTLRSFNSGGSASSKISTIPDLPALVCLQLKHLQPIFSQRAPLPSFLEEDRFLRVVNQIEK
jgi:hypothetical protein